MGGAFVGRWRGRRCPPWRPAGRDSTPWCSTPPTGCVRTSARVTPGSSSPSRRYPRRTPRLGRSRPPRSGGCCAERPARPNRVVVYRRPVEARAQDDLDLADIVREVVTEQVAALLGVPPQRARPGDGPRRGRARPQGRGKARLTSEVTALSSSGHGGEHPGGSGATGGDHGAAQLPAAGDPADPDGRGAVEGHGCDPVGEQVELARHGGTLDDGGDLRGAVATGAHQVERARDAADRREGRAAHDSTPVAAGDQEISPGTGRCRCARTPTRRRARRNAPRWRRCPRRVRSAEARRPLRRRR